MKLSEKVVEKIRMNALSLFKNLEESKRKNLLILFIAGLCFWSSNFLFLPILPTYIKDSANTTTQEVGQIMGFFVIGLLLSRVVMGRVADRNSRKIVVQIGEMAMAMSPISYLLANSIPELMAVRAFHGISIASFTTGYNALVMDLSPKEKRGELSGYMNLVIPIGMGIGPTLGGFLVTSAGYETLLLTSASLGILGLILVCAIEEEEQKENYIIAEEILKTSLESHSPNLMRSLSCQSLIIPTTVMLLVGLMFGTWVTFLPLFVRELDINFYTGLFYTGVAVASFCSRLFLVKESDRLGRGLFVTFGLVSYTISMLLLSLAHTHTMLLLAACAEGIASGIIIPVMLSLVSDRSSRQTRGMVHSLCLGGSDLGISLAGPILGLAIAPFGFQGLFLLDTGVAILALLIFTTSSNKGFIQSFRFAFGREKDLYSLD